MKIVEPSVELLVQSDPIDHVARCARICYQSEPKDEDANRRLYDGLLKRHHYSMFRHETHYYIIPREEDDEYYIKGINTFRNSPYVQIHDNHVDDIYFVANGQWIKENPNASHFLLRYEVDPDWFNDTEYGHEMMRYTFVLTTQIGTSRELNRVSPNNIAEMSTRYINFGGKVEPAICRPHWADKETCLWFMEEGHERRDAVTVRYLGTCENAFINYSDLLKKGLKQEDARGVLPLDTMTKVIYTYSINQWRHIIDLRYKGLTGKPHPNAAIVIGMVKNELEKLGYEF